MNLQVPPDAPLVAHLAAGSILALHISGGTIGMAAGGVAMLTRKGERLHRLAGHAFFFAMLTMAAIGAAVAPFLDEGQWTNTTAGIFTFYLVASAWATVRRGKDEAGGFERVAVAAPIGIALMALVLAFVGPATGRTDGFATVYAIGLAALIAAAGDLKLIRRGGLAGADRIARHAWRMSLAVFVAYGSFFLGQQKFLPAEVRGTILPALPVLFFAGLGIYAFARVRFARTRRAAAAA